LGENGENSFIHGGAITALSSDGGVLIVADSNDMSGPAGSDATMNDIIFGAGSPIDTDASRTFTFSQAFGDGLNSAPRNEFMRIKGTTGNVGIGTTEPQAKLHIAGEAGTDGIMFPDGTLQTTAAGLRVYESSWFPANQATKYPLVHGLGTNMLMVQVFFSTVSNPPSSSTIMVCTDPHANDSQKNGCEVRVNDTNIVLQTGATYIHLGYNDAGAWVTHTSGYYKVVAISLI